MNPDRILSLIGYSEFSPEIQQLLKELAIPPEQPNMSVCWREYQSREWSLRLIFKAGPNFQSDYGSYQKAYRDGLDETFLEEIHFGDQKGKPSYPYPLPFGFTFLDSPEIVFKKAGVRKQRLREASYGSVTDFNTDEYHYVTGFDRTNGLVWIMVKKLEASFLRRREMERSLREMNKQIIIPEASNIQVLRESSPVLCWRKRWMEGDSEFSQRNLEDVENELEKFLDNILLAAGKKNARAIYSAYRKVILAMNKVNDKHKGFIDTLEREELLDYFGKALSMTGFMVEDKMDLSEEWREW